MCGEVGSTGAEGGGFCVLGLCFQPAHEIDISDTVDNGQGFSSMLMLVPPFVTALSQVSPDTAGVHHPVLACVAFLSTRSDRPRPFK